ncbi:MAG: glycosyltransferase family 2 protein [Candidatus Omnitrophica bacterium]|nr:glycosyltransferase family 2 protein [Candidatus Omnitrophota bacterium]
MIRNISVFFPAYNEEKNIEKVVLSTLDFLKEITSDYEIIIVNDGSKDRTGEIAEDLSKKNPQVKVVHHSKNLGYGSALTSGFRNSTKDLVFFMDSDNQFDIKEIRNLLPLLESFDVVVGYRLRRKDSFHRKLNAWLFNLLVNILFCLGIEDVDCGFKLFKKEAVENIKLESKGALISTELLVKIKKRGFRIKQVGVHHYPRMHGKQTGTNFKVILRFFKELIKMGWKLRFS